MKAFDAIVALRNIAISCGIDRKLLRPGNIILKVSGVPQPIAWFAVPSGLDPTHRITAEGLQVWAPPEIYDVFIQPDAAHTPIVWASKLKLLADQDLTIKMETGLSTSVGQNLNLSGRYGWWGVSRTGEPASSRLHWGDVPGVLALPPGRYDVYWTQDNQHNPLLWASNVEVANGVTELKLDSGVRLEKSADLPDLGSYGWWGVARAGRPHAERLNWLTDPGILVLPPAAYDVYVAPYGQEPRLLVEQLVVPKAGITDIKIPRARTRAAGNPRGASPT